MRSLFLAAFALLSLSAIPLPSDAFALRFNVFQSSKESDFTLVSSQKNENTQKGEDSQKNENVQKSKKAFSSASNAPLLSSLNAEIVSNHYVVVLKDHVNHIHAHSQFSALASSFGSVQSRLFNGVHAKPFKIQHENAEEPGIQGFFAHLDDASIDTLRSHPEIAYIEPDSVFRTQELQHDAPWGLARIAHRAHPDGTEAHDYGFDEHAGKGVWAYVVDTGVNVNHADFALPEGGSRAIWGATIPEDDPDEDGNGHGTHVSGTIAGNKYGVAKGATIVAVKVLRSNGGGTLSDVIRGIEWVVNNHTARVDAATIAEGAEGRKKTKSVANMSLGGGRSPSLDKAVDAAVGAGVLFAVAAGNDGMDACQYSPAASTKAITVGATTIEDTMAWFSNSGKCVDIFAPGHQILSSWIGSPVATNTISGTSMASPHIAGLAALFSSEPKYAGLSPKQLKDHLIEVATTGVITGMPFWTHSKNRLAFNDPPKF